MSTPRARRSGVTWAIAGGVVLIGAVIAIIISAILSQPEPTTSPSSPTEPSTSSTTEPSTDTAEFVDSSVTEQGWAPEPITTDREEYIAAALEAASTFDTTLSTREEWLDYLDTWFTPDTRFTSPDDQLAAMEDFQVELRQGVVLPAEQWESLRIEDGRVVAVATGEIVFVPVTEDASGEMSIGTSDVTLTFSRSDGGDGETSYDAAVRVSVQVLCGAGSIPTPNSAQEAGDCKVVRYFTEPLEP